MASFFLLLLRQYCSPFVMFSLELWMILFLQDVGCICSSAIWNNASLQLQITEKMRTSTLFCSVGHLVRRGMKQYLLILIEITGFQELSFKKMVTTIQSWGFALTKYPCMRKSKFNLELRNKRTFRHFASFFVFLEGKMFNVACVAEQTDFPRTGWPSDVEEDISGVEAQEEVLRFGRDDFTTGFYRSSNSGHRHNGTQLTKRSRDCC